MLRLDGRHRQRGRLTRGGIVRLDQVGRGRALGRTGVDLELFGPLARHIVEDFFFLARGEQGSGEAVLFAREPPFTAVVDLGGEPGRGGDVAGRVELDEGGS